MGWRDQLFESELQRDKNDSRNFLSFKHVNDILLRWPSKFIENRKPERESNMQSTGLIEKLSTMKRGNGWDQNELNSGDHSLLILLFLLVAIFWSFSHMKPRKCTSEEQLKRFFKFEIEAILDTPGTPQLVDEECVVPNWAWSGRFSLSF
jgi:hypothetical protein